MYVWGETRFCNKEARPSNTTVNYVKPQSEIDIRDVYNNYTAMIFCSCHISRKASVFARYNKTYVHLFVFIIASLFC